MTRTLSSQPLRSRCDHTAGNSVLPKDITLILHPASRAQMVRGLGGWRSSHAFRCTSKIEHE